MDASAKLTESELSTLLEASFDSVLILNDQREIVRVNQVAVLQFGLSLEQIVGTRLDDYRCQEPDDIELFWRSLLESGRLEGSLCLKRPDGLVTNYDYIGLASFQPGNHLLILRSISSRLELIRRTQADAAKLVEANQTLQNTKIALINALEDFSGEKQLLELEKRKVEAIIASIGDAVFVTDTAGKINLMNPVAEKYSGFSSSEAVGLHYSSVFRFINEAAPQTPFPDFVGQVVQTRKIQEMSGRVQLKRKDGSLMPVSDSAAPIVDNQNRILGCVVVVRDFSRERELEQAKDDFLSVAAHQLRTPLGALRWGLELMLAGDMGPLSEKSKTALEGYHENVLRMISLVNDLLDVSRIDQQRVRDYPEMIDLDNLIHEQISQFKDEATERNLVINYTAPDNLMSSISIDRVRLTQVIDNLLNNAIKYSKPEGGQIEVRLSQLPQEIRISVKDQGIGIPAESLPKLFSKFFRAENAVISETEGSGLGLFVVKSFVEHWGGRVEVETKEGEGSTFSVVIPLNPTNQQSIQAGTIPKATAGI
jgi:two-component system phosphate regulon sensor histidine kinase PhoR